VAIPSVRELWYLDHDVYRIVTKVLCMSRGPVETASVHENRSLPFNLSSHARLNRLVALQFACLKVTLRHTTLNVLSAADLKRSEDSLHSIVSTAHSTSPSLSGTHINSQLDTSCLRVQFIAVRSKAFQVVGNELKKGAEFVEFP
jgi:hypothetical protein